MTASPIADTSPTTTGCVHCHEPLTLRSHETIEVLVCGSGHGMFLHADSLRAALADRTDDRSETEEQAAETAQGAIAIETIEANEQPRTCPTCGTGMAKRVYAYESGVTTDVCDEHGVWLDHDELERIEAWYEAQERHLASDRATWGGQSGKLEQIEEDFERTAVDDEASMHWGPIAAFHRRIAWAWARRDDR